MFKRLCAVVLVAALFAPATAFAHDGDGSIQQLTFDRPEAWALKYFASATLLSGLEPPATRDLWSVSIGLEIGWLKPASAAERFVGFDGLKQEDLNKAPFFVRPRVTVGLPGRFTLLVAGNPPIKTFGVTPRLLALGLERPLYEGDSWAFGARAFGQVGTVKGAYTCPTSVLAFAPGSPGNLYGCQAASSDTASLNFAGLEMTVEHRAKGRRLSPHASLGVNYMDVGFHVDALTFGFVDHTRYTSRGVTVSGSVGVSYPLTSSVTAALDGFYTPLSVRRFGAMQNNAFFNVRALLAYRFR